MKLVLFDIDGTLVLTGGAGKRSMTRAYHEIFGIDNALEKINFSGMTDLLIFRLASEQFGREFSFEAHRKFKAAYLTYLVEEILLEHPEKRLLPGVVDLLEALKKRPDVTLGLLTGNYAESAQIKLEHFNVFHYFSCGAYGDDHENRDRLVPFALERIPPKNKAPESADVEVWVVGDTPRDIACARPHGAKAVAVATGFYSLDELKSHSPDFYFENLDDTGSVLEIFN